jgi:hypothetical protein
MLGTSTSSQWKKGTLVLYRLREYVGNFLGILQQRLTGTETKPEQEEKQYQGYMLQCYQSLGRYVKNLKRPEDPEFTINVSYYFQGISISNLIELINYYLSLDDEVILKKQADSPGFKTRKKEIQVIANKLQDFMNDDNYKANYKKNIYIVFSKKNAMKALEKIVKNDIEFSEKYFQNTPNNGENVIKTLEFFYSKRREIMGEFDKLDLKIIGLLRDYLRSIDLNYIEATKSYFKEQFTLIDLLRRDKINKRFTKVSHIKMDVDGGISFSVEMAADYLVQKMEEWKEDVTLTGDCIRNSDPMNLYQSNFSNSVDEFGVEALPNLEKKNAVYNMNLFELDSKKYKFIKYIRFLSCENRIRVKYFQHLATNLARSKSLFENRFILPFDITMRFGLEALEKMVAFQFVEKHLLEVTNLNLKIEMSEDEITVLADEEIVDNPPQNIQSILTLSGFGRKKVGRGNAGSETELLHLGSHTSEVAEHQHLRGGVHVSEVLARAGRLYDHGHRPAQLQGRAP